MCGRFALYSSHAKIARQFGLSHVTDLITSYNIAPTEMISVVVMMPDATRRLTNMRWGLIPPWQKEAPVGAPLINARLETVAVKPAFRHAVKAHRCLIITDGFYEWRVVNKAKQPYFIRERDNEPFAFAGIWESSLIGESRVDTCCIITREAESQLSALHDRMPAIVAPADYNTWLDPARATWDDVKAVLAMPPDIPFTYYPVSSKVNRARYKAHDCITPVE